jgi:hypothetical protein
VATALVFSLTEIAAVAPPPFDVMMGASFTLPTVMAMACVSDSVFEKGIPSVTLA